MVGASNPTLQDREIRLNGVRMSIATDVLSNAVIDDFMAKISMHMMILSRVVSHQKRTCIQLGDQNRPQSLCSDPGHLLRADPAPTLDQRERYLFTLTADIGRVALRAVFVFLFPTYVRFIGLNCLSFAAHRDGVEFAHPLTNAVSHKPSCFVRESKHSVELMRRDALLARAHQVRRKEPFSHQDVGTLVDRPDRSREFPAAVLAVVPSWSHRLAAQRLDGVCLAAVRAVRSIRPTDGLKVLSRRVRVGEDRVSQVNGGHGVSP